MARPTLSASVIAVTRPQPLWAEQLGLPWINVGIMTLFQRRTPPELMGRTDAALGLALSTPQTIAIAVGAALIAVVDYRILLLAIASLAALASAYLFTRPEHRRSALSEPATAAADTAPQSPVTP